MEQRTIIRFKLVKLGERVLLVSGNSRREEVEMLATCREYLGELAIR